VTLRRPRRIDGFEYRGPNRYLLTFCTSNRKRLFVNTPLIADVFHEFRNTADDEAFALLAYCFMPDHVHFLVEGIEDRSDLRRFVKIGKQRAEYVARRRHRSYPLWQEGYHDWVLRSDERAEEMIRYILDNPVRARLVERWEQYAHSGTMFPLV
jgi:putative transposase